MSSLLNPPESRPLWSDDGPPRTVPPTPPSPPGGRRRRPPLALLLVVCSLLGGGTTVGALAATGRLDHDASTTTVVQRTTATGDASASGLDAQALYAATSAGVVDITSKGVSSGAGPFGRQSTSTATGTGFEVDDQGHIVTAAHVVDGASSVTVKLADGTTRKATVLGQDNATDIAVLKIDPSGLKLSPLKLGSSSSVDVGAAVAAVGDPFGYERSISTGIISGVDRTILAPNGFTVAHALQTDAAMNPGNSGGPVLDASGAVIGIADQIATDGSADQSSGVGFAVPVDLVKSELTALETGKSVAHASLGVGTSDASSGGATVAQVSADGPAASSGLRAGDVITKLGDTTISDRNDLVAAIASQAPGDKVTVTVTRGSSTTELEVMLGTQPG